MRTDAKRLEVVQVKCGLEGSLCDLQVRFHGVCLPSTKKVTLLPGTTIYVTYRPSARRSSL